MEAACHAGIRLPKPQLAIPFDVNHAALISALQPFDGWVISLLETNISLLQTVHNPETGGIRVDGLKDSFAQLWNLRMPGYKPFKNFPDVFDMAIFMQ